MGRLSVPYLVSIFSDQKTIQPQTVTSVNVHELHACPETRVNLATRQRL